MNIDINQLEFIDLRLRAMALDVEKQFGVEFKVTSLFRMNDKGVHGQLPLRGVDFSCKNDALGKAVEAYVRSIWNYNNDNGKHCCMYHENRGGGGNHIHLQVHPNTKLKTEE